MPNILTKISLSHPPDLIRDLILWLEVGICLVIIDFEVSRIFQR